MRIIDAGGSAFVVNEESLNALVDIFK